jgi:hypothetical protein
MEDPTLLYDFETVNSFIYKKHYSDHHGVLMLISDRSGEMGPENAPHSERISWRSERSRCTYGFGIFGKGGNEDLLSGADSPPPRGRGPL